MPTGNFANLCPRHNLFVEIQIRYQLLGRSNLLKLEGKNIQHKCGFSRNNDLAKANKNISHRRPKVRCN